VKECIRYYMKKKDIINLLFLIVAVTALHYFTIANEGEIHDFYRRLYYIPIILAAFKYHFKGGLITSLVVSTLYSPHIFIFKKLENIGLANQLLEIVLFIFIGSLTGYLVEQLYQKNLMLTEQLEKIRKVEKLNDRILDSMQNALVSIDIKHNITLVNKVARETLFVDSISSSNFMKRINPEIIEVLKGKTKSIKKKVAYRINESNLLFQILITSIHGNSEIEGALIIIEDITERTKFEEEFLKSEKLSAVGLMASSLAHEIRNPLGIIKTIIQTILSKKTVSTDDMDGLEIIDSEINRTNKVISELLNYSKPMKGLKTIEFIGEVVLETERFIKRYANEKNIDVICEIEMDVPVCIIKDRFKQALINIILNSIQAMPDGGIVRIKVLIKDNEVELSIIDNGIGISQENIKQVFTPFYTTKVSGTGLGLSMTLKIIEEHDGHIEIISEQNIGTNITIRMPIYTAGEVENA